jgi:DNA-binding NtrC family response regulator
MPIQLELPFAEDFKSGTTAEANSAKILLVDDELVVGKALEKILSRKGYEVTRCTSAEAALQAFRENPSDFGVLITDQSMPEMTGHNLAVAVHELSPSLPIIIQSGLVSPTLFKAIGQHGIRQIFQKPVPSRILTQAVLKCLHTSA